MIIHIQINLYCIIKELIFLFTRTRTIFNKYVLQTVIISIDYNLQFTLYDHSFTVDGSYANCSSTIFGNAQHGLVDHSNTSVVFTNFTIIEPSLWNIGDCLGILRNGEVNGRFCSDLVSLRCNMWKRDFYL